MFWVTPALGALGLSDAGYSNPDNGYPQGSIDTTNIMVQNASFPILYVLNNMEAQDQSHKGDPIQLVRLAGESKAILYLGRHDKKTNFGVCSPSFDGSKTNYVFQNVYARLFEEEDIGKPIPVWISTEPPPY